MGFDRSGSACGNIARSDAQHGGYASGKTLHPDTGSANAHADRDADPHGDSNTDPHANTNTYANAHPNRDSYVDPYSFARANEYANSNPYSRDADAN